MAQLTIRVDSAHTPSRCGLCGCPVPGGGPHLSVAEGTRVCRDCGKRHAPSLVALLDLARVAERVGRIGRHTVVPPMAAILDLVKAAEDYLHLTPAQGPRASAVARPVAAARG
ncbi:MAG: hypothetical protein L0Z62_20125 [Gemmataceae bacterium]|nr:hypothetical protein [Gemmataceae bacterium]